MKLELDVETLRPLLEEVVKATVAAMEESAARLPAGRIAFTESEAAAALGIPRHRLRDARLRGEVSAKLVGKGYLYHRKSLETFLENPDT